VGDKLIKGIVWSYPASIPECPKIENQFSFYNERVNLYVMECSKIDRSPRFLNFEIGVLRCLRLYRLLKDVHFVRLGTGAAAQVQVNVRRVMGEAAQTWASANPPK